MSLDAAWGNGKTTFLNMWKQHLVNQGFPVFSFNAWETDFTGSPFVALSSELLAGLQYHENTNSSELNTLERRTQNLLRILVTKGAPWAISMAGLAVGI